MQQVNVTSKINTMNINVLLVLIYIFFLKTFFTVVILKRNLRKINKNKFIDKVRIRFVNNIKKMFSKILFLKML